MFLAVLNADVNRPLAVRLVIRGISFDRRKLGLVEKVNHNGTTDTTYEKQVIGQRRDRCVVVVYSAR